MNLLGLVTETIFVGSLLLAIPLALIAGAVSFFSPCVLPLVPAYLSMITGLTGEQLSPSDSGSGDRNVPTDKAPTNAPAPHTAYSHR